MCSTTVFLTAALAVGVSCLPAPQAAVASNSTAVTSSAATSSATVATSAAESTSSKAVASDGSYQQFTGDGTTGAGWPDQSAWVSFDDAFTANQPTMLGSDSQDEVDTIKSSINSVSGSTGVDPRFILAVVMQESEGNVRVGTTANGVSNPGLMQSHNGVSCAGQTPCPDATITQMIQDGTGGTTDGDGLQQCLTQAGGTDVSQFYKAARIYNSGSLSGDDLAAGAANPCYSSDIANRLIGFVGTSGCSLTG